ncbi:MAG: ribose-phosphate pyrophosphokinase [Puniceicoccales bacterium]|jgi:ribose-phosphate pyrophosphokinase|nr:ribose-phosphate pyrophosphokinase [Puniceicoccales bacterium]
MKRLISPYNDIKIFSGTSNPTLAESICSFLGTKISRVKIENFPDGEIGVQIEESVRGGDVFIVQSTNFPANDNYMELLILIDAAKRASAGRITAVLPFFGYARQDRKDKSRVPVTAKLVANLLVAAGADRILSMDMHSQQLVGFFDIPVDHLFASALFIKYLRNENAKNLTICSPDFGNAKMAVAYADALGCPLALVGKRRCGGNDVKSLNVIGEINGRDILFVDDMVVTAKTLVEAAKLLKKNGANSIKAAVTHCILTKSGYDLLTNSVIDQLLTTNSTRIAYENERFTILNINGIFGEAITRIHNNASITDLFEIKGI